MKRKPFVPLYDSISTLLREMGTELLSETKGELVADLVSRYTAYVIMRLNETLE